ncbi:MAG: ABC transporter ATP-binding protein [Acidobacteriota bacterium]
MSFEAQGREPVIHLRHLSKKYPIYSSPSHKLLELMTLRKKQFHREFWALSDVDLEVGGATTLGVVGQNGSGKSTLLQILAGILQPTRGDCRVKGTVSALLELGAGFNPEFTGRENIYMNGAIMGFTHRQMARREKPILAFAEIGEFIDQPVKTYSSGMFMRLAFSVAIHVDPDILLIDEALAVGDLVFQHRCTNRMRQLREGGKTIVS